MEGQLEVTGPTLLAGMKPGASFDDFNVHLVRSKACSFAGLEIELKNDGYFTLVKAILENSLAAAWNASHGPEEQLMPGLRILNVNGVSGSSPQSVDELKAAKELKLTLRRMNSVRLSSEVSLGVIEEGSPPEHTAELPSLELPAVSDEIPVAKTEGIEASQSPATLPDESLVEKQEAVADAGPSIVSGAVEPEEPPSETSEAKVANRPCPVYTAELIPMPEVGGLTGDLVVAPARGCHSMSFLGAWCCTTEAS
mmetsp:Transcript_4937/g.11529  ORF Transcript_4937/g.11529 Transcript_4937/m.11529 type:complete len:254 (+) Transcript_4937:47-808(+)